MNGRGRSGDYRSNRRTGPVLQEIEAALRSQISENLAGQLGENCLLAKFISAVTGGYVCFDPVTRKLSSHHGFDYRRDPGAGVAANGGRD